MGTDGAPAPHSNQQPDQEVQRASPDVSEAIERADERARDRYRDAARELRKAAMRGSAFQFGKEATKELINEFLKIITDN
jgi:hypothetical protein